MRFSILYYSQIIIKRFPTVLRHYDDFVLLLLMTGILPDRVYFDFFFSSLLLFIIFLPLEPSTRNDPFPQ